jgi:hypothetical protein
VSQSVATAVYFLCALTSTACAALLIRAYLRNRVLFLFWCSLCFAGLALNNWGLVLDMVLVPSIDFSLCRVVPAFLGTAALIYGLVWEVDF